MITYPARPAQGDRFNAPADIPMKRIYRPKVDGSRVLVDVWEQQAFNRLGDHYSKAEQLPWGSLEALARRIGSTLLDAPTEILQTFLGSSEVTQGVRWLDIEFFDKHEEMKGGCAFIDAPSRLMSFKGLLHLLAHSHIPVSSPLKYGCIGVAPDLCTRVEGGPMLPEILPRIYWLPYWECVDESDQKIIHTLWDLLKNESKRLMVRDIESTPFYEGLVSVDSDSEYPRQLRNPKEICPTWTKYRFSH